MATCKWCGKSGLFLPLTENGLCKPCDVIIVTELIYATQHINESIDLIKQSSNTDTIVSRFDYIVKLLNSLLKYEKKGITTINPPPSEAIKSYSPAKRDIHIVYGLEKELEKLKLVVVDLKTNSGKVNRVKKFSARCEEYKKQLLNPAELTEIEEETEQLLGEQSQ